MSIALALTSIFLWSINYPLSKLMVTHLPPLISMSIRCAIGGALLVGFAGLPSRDEIKSIVKISLNQFTLNFTFFALGIQYTSASLASLITQIDVPFTILLSVIFLNEKFKFHYIIGFVISLTGIYIASMTEHTLLSFNPASILFLILSSLFYSISVIQIKNSSIHLFKLNAWGLIFASLALVILSFFIEKDWNTLEILNFNLIYVVLIALSSTIAFLLWSYLIKKMNVSKLSSLLLLIPALSMLLSGFILNEPMSFRFIVGILFTILGISLFYLQDVWNTFVNKSKESL